jgi:dCMP deaminase
MRYAESEAKKSPDPVTKVGAVIVKDKKEVSTGFNCMPKGCENFSWYKDKYDELKDKRTYVAHAELNAFVNAKNVNVEGCTIFVTLFPCNECAKIIIQSGIVEVFYSSDKRAGKAGTIASKRMLDAAGVKYTQL